MCARPESDILEDEAHRPKKKPPFRRENEISRERFQKLAHAYQVHDAIDTSFSYLLLYSFSFPGRRKFTHPFSPTAKSPEVHTAYIILLILCKARCYLFSSFSLSVSLAMYLDLRSEIHKRPFVVNAFPPSRSVSSTW